MHVRDATYTAVAYQRWNLPPKFRHQMDVYQPPADPFDTLSSYRSAYSGRTAPVRPSMKPDDSAHMSDAPLDDVTTCRAAYVRHPLPDVEPKQKAMWLPNPAELDDLTNYRKEYTRKGRGRVRFSDRALVRIYGEMSIGRVSYIRIYLCYFCFR